ncbi:hypothetical protein LR48_Vigan03g223800 [Vigna angularis]|uniref:Uncharacterized protein n=1 Tax=Phaseolus angularis TaxID=3914 RepID=A0A0L9U7Z4_PHAAN|nr:hypothetical protein LR48_Vigan03g223800 [Vigna angularis]
MASPHLSKDVLVATPTNRSAQISSNQFMQTIHSLVVPSSPKGNQWKQTKTQ